MCTRGRPCNAQGPCRPMQCNLILVSVPPANSDYAIRATVPATHTTPRHRSSLPHSRSSLPHSQQEQLTVQTQGLAESFSCHCNMHHAPNARCCRLLYVICVAFRAWRGQLAHADGPGAAGCPASSALAVVYARTPAVHSLMCLRGVI